MILLSTLDDANNKLITTVDDQYTFAKRNAFTTRVTPGSNSNAYKANGLSRDVQNQINRILFKWSLYIPYEYLMVVQGIPLTRIYHIF